MSLFPAKTCDAPIATADVPGLFGSETSRLIAFHSIVVFIMCPFISMNVLVSRTTAPMVVGNTGAFAPDSIRGIASYVIIEVPIACHVTEPSTTSKPSVVGHVGSVAAEMPDDGCTASYKKFVGREGDARFQKRPPTYPSLRVIVPEPA